MSGALQTAGTIPPGPVSPTEAAAGAGARRGDAVWRRILRNPSAVGSAAILAILVLVALLAPWIAPFDPEFRDRTAVLTGPGAAHWLGTDDLGRDVLTRLMYAGRVSLTVGLSVVVCALAVALPIGLVAGYRGGRVDSIVMRFVDGALSFPALVLALAIAGVLGPGVANTVLALTIVMTPALIRLIRGQALVVRQETFVEASLSIGTRARTILVSRMLPNVASVVIVQASYVMGAALLAEAALSYLGLGAPPPTPTWGSMLRRSYDTALFLEPVQLVAASAAIVGAVFAANMLGDGLRDALGVARPQRRRGGRRGLTSVDRPHPATTVPAMDRPAEVLLSITGLSVEFTAPDGSTVRVVEDVGLDIRAGEVVGLVGESGSGKSVTALSIMRLVPPHVARIVEGSVRLQGRDLLDLGLDGMREIRGREIGMIFQDPMSSLDPAFTVGDQLVEAQVVHGVNRHVARRKAVDMLELVGIPAPRERLSAYPHQLSGGTRQRVMIALALVNDPALLIADEPTTALDVTVQAEILDLLRRLQRELGMSILFITHDLGVVADLCDRVAVMYAGQIVEEQPVLDLFAAPRHPYTEGLLGATPRLEGGGDRLVVIPGSVPIAGEMPDGCRFAPRCAHAVDDCSRAAISLSGRSDSRVRCVRAAELTLEGAR